MKADEAAEFYVSIFPNSRIVTSAPYPEGTEPAGSTMFVEFELDGQRMVGINGGPQFKFNEAISLEISCKDQPQVDYFWERLADGGEEGKCGWFKDRFGVSWQVTPPGMNELFAGDGDRAARATPAMFKMSKLDGDALRAAADGVAPG